MTSLITFEDIQLPAAEAQAGDTFERFAALPFYMDVNRRLVERAAKDEALGQTVLEIASGTGGVTQILLEVWAKPHGARVLALEPSRSAIDTATRRLEAAGLASPENVEFLHAPVSRLTEVVAARAPGGAVDSLFFCNAIHLLDDAAKRQALKEIRVALRKGGLLVLNSTFFDGAAPEHTHAFFRNWMMACVRDLRRTGYSLEKGKVSARQQLTAEAIEELLREADFTDIRIWLDPVEIPAEGLEAIGEYLPFASGALPGIPEDLAVEALQRNVAPALAAQGLETVTRNWLQVMARA